MVVDLVQACSLIPKSGLEFKQQYPAGRRGCVIGLCSVDQVGKGNVQGMLGLQLVMYRVDSSLHT
jgi:hypothetical protein